MADPSPDPAAAFDWAAAERQLRNVSDVDPIATDVENPTPAGLPADTPRATPTDRDSRHDLQATVWRTYGIAQLVLWLTVVVAGRVRLLTDGDPASWMHLVAPVAVVVTLLTWVWALRPARGGLRGLRSVVGWQRLLQVGLLAHGLCLVALLTSFLLAGGAGQIAFGAGVLFLVIASGAVWLRARRENNATTR